MQRPATVSVARMGRSGIRGLLPAFFLARRFTYGPLPLEEERPHTLALPLLSCSATRIAEMNPSTPATPTLTASSRSFIEAVRVCLTAQGRIRATPELLCRHFR